jgi:hypothetical protein
VTKKRIYDKLIFYPTGLISIIVLPLLCIWYFDKIDALKEFGNINMVWGDSSLCSRISKESLPGIYYEDILLTGDNLADKKSLSIAQIQIRNLVLSGDTSKGVHFHFNDNSMYWTLIEAIDICNTENAKVYIPYQNDIWVLNPRPSTRHNKIMGCIGPIQPSNSIVWIEIIQTEYINVLYSNIDIVKLFCIPIIIYLMMVFMTVRRIINILS